MFFLCYRLVTRDCVLNCPLSKCLCGITNCIPYGVKIQLTVGYKFVFVELQKLEVFETEAALRLLMASMRGEKSFYYVMFMKYYKIIQNATYYLAKFNVVPGLLVLRVI